MCNVSELIGKEVVIDKRFKGEFYYECECGMDFDYDWLDKFGWNGVVVDVSSGRNVNVVVLVGDEEKKYFELEDIELLLDGECVSSWIDEWDWENVVGGYEYKDGSGYMES